jgi:hypothetical protein
MLSVRALERELASQEPETSLFLYTLHLKHFNRLVFLNKVLLVLIAFPLLIFLAAYAYFQWDVTQEQYWIVFFAGMVATTLWVILVWLSQEKNRRISCLLHQVQMTLFAHASWPQSLRPLLSLMEQTGWLQKPELWLWWWGGTYPILIRWLPRLQAGELGSSECRTLRKLLHLNPQYEDLQVAILLALGTARDAKARRVATKLLQHSPQERVREAARDCLQELGVGH